MTTHREEKKGPAPEGTKKKVRSSPKGRLTINRKKRLVIKTSSKEGGGDLRNESGQRDYRVILKKFREALSDQALTKRIRKRRGRGEGRF